MAKEKPIIFQENKIPFLFNETVGKVTFISKRSDKFERDEEGKRTDIIRLQSIELSSEEQHQTFNVDLPPEVDLSSFQFGDLVEIEGVEFAEPWAQLPSGDTNPNNAYTGFSIVATGIHKVKNFSSQSEVSAPNHSSKSTEKGEKGKV